MKWILNKMISKLTDLQTLKNFESTVSNNTFYTISIIRIMLCSPYYLYTFIYTGCCQILFTNSQARRKGKHTIETNDAFNKKYRGFYRN